jgi:hypothetical protein
LLIVSGRTCVKKKPDRYVNGKLTLPNPFNSEDMSNPTAHNHETIVESVVVPPRLLSSSLFPSPIGSWTTHGPMELSTITVVVMPIKLPVIPIQNCITGK